MIKYTYLEEKFFSYLYAYYYIGRDAEDSHSNLTEWLDTVYSNEDLPSDGLVNTLTRHRKVKGVYHHLSGEEAHEFVKVIQVKLLDWSVQCTMQGLSAGSLLQSTASGRGQITLVAQKVGPFSD